MLRWSAVPEASSYNIYRSTTAGAQGAKIAATSSTSYVDSSAENGTTYFYQVTADNAAGEGSASAQSPGITPAMPLTVPAAPTGLHASAGDARVTLDWTPVAGARSYNVRRSTDPGTPGTKIGSSSTAQYVDLAVSNGSTYYYAVSADNAAGEGPASAPTAGATPSAPLSPPAAPAGLSAVAGNALDGRSRRDLVQRLPLDLRGSPGREDRLERHQPLRRHQRGQRHDLPLPGHGRERGR
jgi:fibronectin type 3 domain-containing protein